MDRGQSTAHGVANMTEGLSFHFPLAASKQALTRVFFYLRQTECSAPSSLTIWV